MIYLILSFDDSSKHIVRCAKLLDKYELKGTFYLDIMKMRSELKVEDVRWISSWNEIGAHSVTHRDLSKLVSNEAYHEIVKSKITLENIIEKPVRTFAYPLGKFDRETIELVKLCGFENARTTKPFNTSPLINNPYTIDVTFYTDPHAYRLLLKAIRKLRMWKIAIRPWLLKRWNHLIRSFLKENYHKANEVYTHLLIHPDFIEHRNDWDELEELFAEIQSTTNTINLTVSEFVSKT